MGRIKPGMLGHPHHRRLINAIKSSPAKCPMWIRKKQNKHLYSAGVNYSHSTGLQMRHWIKMSQKAANIRQADWFYALSDLRHSPVRHDSSSPSALAQSGGKPHWHMKPQEASLMWKLFLRGGAWTPVSLYVVQARCSVF